MIDPTTAYYRRRAIEVSDLRPLLDVVLVLQTILEELQRALKEDARRRV